MLNLLHWARDARFGSKVGQMCPRWDKSGAFSDQISVHLARPIWGPNLIWKSPGFVQFGANLPHFGAKPSIPSVHEYFSPYIHRLLPTIVTWLVDVITWLITIHTARTQLTAYFYLRILLSTDTPMYAYSNVHILQCMHTPMYAYFTVLILLCPSFCLSIRLAVS